MKALIGALVLIAIIGGGALACLIIYASGGSASIVVGV